MISDTDPTYSDVTNKFLVSCWLRIVKPQLGEIGSVQAFERNLYAFSFPCAPYLGGYPLSIAMSLEQIAEHLQSTGTFLAWLQHHGLKYATLRK